VRKAERNPFYIEEVVRSLVDQGVIDVRHGRFRVTGTIESVVIPGTIVEVVMARVDRLPDRPRRILQIASVVGRRFPYAVLAEIVRDDPQLEWALGHLERSELLEECRIWWGTRRRRSAPVPSSGGPTARSACVWPRAGGRASSAAWTAARTSPPPSACSRSST
jgi:hypothetical protein